MRVDRALKKPPFAELIVSGNFIQAGNPATARPITFTLPSNDLRQTQYHARGQHQRDSGHVPTPGGRDLFPGALFQQIAHIGGE
jgi:hypothetical protein